MTEVDIEKKVQNLKIETSGEEEAVTPEGKQMVEPSKSLTDQVRAEDENLFEMLVNLGAPVLAEGPNIYELWKDLLRRFLETNNSRCTVYVVTPYVDSEIMKDIYKIVLDAESSTKIIMFVRIRCNTYGNEDINAVKENAKKKLGLIESKRDVIIDKVDKNIKIPPHTFYAKFLGLQDARDETNSGAKVLVTSANCTVWHFKSFPKDGLCNLDSVAYNEMSVNNFEKHYVRPLQRN